MRIEPATEQDLPGILAIYNEVVANSTAIYSEVSSTLEQRVEWFRARTQAGYPVLIARDQLELVGFASFGEFRTFPGYRYTVEHSVHVRADRRGQGVGTALMRALIPIAHELGKHVMVAGIDADNTGSIRMHERLGFERVAHMPQVGAKFGRWLDLVFLSLRLDNAERPAS